MKFIDLVLKRQSDRKYQSKPVLRPLIEKCLEAARLAPSACNSQPWSFVVADDPVLVKKLASKTTGLLWTFNKFVPQAPVIVAFVLEPPKMITTVGGKIKDKDYPLIDIGIAAEHFCLQAAELDLGSCMLGWFDEPAVAKLLKVPSNKRIPLLITLGYAPEGYRQRKKIRKPFEQVVRYNFYEP